MFYSDNFSFKGNFSKTEPYLKDVPLLPIKVGETIVLKNIFYDFNSYQLKSESKIELNRLVGFLVQYPSVKIEISGHTDNVGSEEYNLSLSENRAKEVANYLINSGISAERLTSKGYGFTKPVSGNETEEDRSQNRRTEITIISK
ncbi:MAG: OmpA family protein [Bacteroidales bacterium]|nr:OmpA family protein [Bacteroidales bacterium]